MDLNLLCGVKKIPTSKSADQMIALIWHSGDDKIIEIDGKQISARGEREEGMPLQRNLPRGFLWANGGVL